MKHITYGRPRAAALHVAALFTATFCSALTAQAAMPDFMAPAMEGKHLCSDPVTTQKTCNSIVSYTADAGGFVSNELYLYTQPRIFFLQASMHYQARPDAICSNIPESEADAVQFLSADMTPLPAAEAQPMRDSLRASLKSSGESCFAIVPQENGFVLKKVGGGKVSDRSKKVLWIDPQDGWRVAVAAVGALKDALPPIAEGRLFCAAPTAKGKGCASFDAYTENNGAIIRTRTETVMQRIDGRGDYRVFITVTTPARVRDEGLCTYLYKEDITKAKFGTLYQNFYNDPGRMPTEAETYAAYSAPLLGRRVCTAYSGDGKTWNAAVTIDGIAHPEMSGPGIWVKPTDGYSLYSGAAAVFAAPKVVTTIPAFPPAVELDDLPIIAEARQTYEQLTGPNWNPANRLAATAMQVKGKMFCEKATGPAEIAFPHAPLFQPLNQFVLSVRVIEAGCKGTGVTRGLIAAQDGSMWVGDVQITRGSIIPTIIGKGVNIRVSDGYDPVFAVTDRTRTGGFWRAMGNPTGGDMLVSLEERGLFTSRQIGEQFVSDGAVRTRLILPGAGYIDGLTSTNIYGGMVMAKQFTAMDGAFQVTGDVTVSSAPKDIEGFPAPIRFAGSSGIYNGSTDTPRASHIVLIGTDKAPLIIDTFAVTDLGPPGRYLYADRLKPGKLPPADHVTPDPAIKLLITPDAAADMNEVAKWNAAVDRLYARYMAASEKAFNVEHAEHAQTMANYQQNAAEQQAAAAAQRREQRAMEEQDRAELHAHIMGGIAEMQDSVIEGARDIQDAREMAQDAMDDQAREVRRRERQRQEQQRRETQNAQNAQVDRAAQARVQSQEYAAKRQQQLALQVAKPRPQVSVGQSINFGGGPAPATTTATASAESVASDRSAVVAWKEGIAICEMNGDKVGTCYGPQLSVLTGSVEEKVANACDTGTPRELNGEGGFRVFGCGFGIKPGDTSDFAFSMHYDWAAAKSLVAAGRRTFHCPANQVDPRWCTTP